MHWPRALPGTPFLQRVHGSLPHLHQVGHLPRGAFPDRPVYLAPLHVLPTHQASHWQPAVPLSPALMAADAPRAVPNASDAEGSLRVPEGRPAPPQSRCPHCGGFSLHLGMLPRGPGSWGSGDPPAFPRGRDLLPTQRGRGWQEDSAGTEPGPASSGAERCPGSPCRPPRTPGTVPPRGSARAAPAAREGFAAFGCQTLTPV